MEKFIYRVYNVHEKFLLRNGADKECFYLLAMLDYVSRINGIPLYSKYDNLRCMKLQTVVYPSGIIIESVLFPEKPVKANAYNSAIPEFKKFNIVESDVRNVV